MNKKRRFFTIRGQLIVGLTISLIALALAILPIVTFDEVTARSRPPLVKNNCDYTTPSIIWSGENNTIMTVDKSMKFCAAVKIPQQTALTTSNENPIYPTTETISFATFDVSDFDFHADWKVIALTE